MKTTTLKCKWWIALILASQAWAFAGEETAPPIRLSLISEVTQIQPGVPFTVGIFLQHAPHHHSYYKFPGIVGVPTNVTWELPKGFEAGPLQWPTPEQVDMRGHGAYGYHEDTLLLVEITPPTSLPLQETVRLVGKVGYMCCSQERCTPGFEDLKLTLPVAKEQAWEESWHGRFEKTRAALPRPLEGWQSTVHETETHFQLTLQPPISVDKAGLPNAEALYFFSWNGRTASNEPHVCQWRDGQFIFTMPKHPFPDEDAQHFQGVIRNETGWSHGSKGLWIDLPK
jgi:DsbC/DsbD-like thiol-disulfide interchange protein